MALITTGTTSHNPRGTFCPPAASNISKLVVVSAKRARTQVERHHHTHTRMRLARQVPHFVHVRSHPPCALNVDHHQHTNVTQPKRARHRQRWPACARHDVESATNSSIDCGPGPYSQVGQQNTSIIGLRAPLRNRTICLQNTLESPVDTRAITPSANRTPL